MRRSSTCDDELGRGTEVESRFKNSFGCLYDIDAGILFITCLAAKFVKGYLVLNFF